MKIHFIGIGGIGVSALAGIYLKRGHQITGSDLVESSTARALKKQGAKIYIGEHRAKNLAQDTDLVIYTAATTKNNPEIIKARKLKIKTQTYAQALGDLTKQMFTIAVSGMHGKSTTTAMIALVLEKAGLDPSVIIGTKLREWGNLNYRVGKNRYLVIEADEYKASFLNYWPKIIVLTNIEEEHLDYYKDIKHILATFKKYVEHLGKDGILIYNEEDRNIGQLIQWLKVRSQKYNSKVRIRGLKLKIAGKHNISNALAALKVAEVLKIPRKIVLTVLNNFCGTWRRMEYKGMVNGARIYDDYGHHPTEIKATLQGARQVIESCKPKSKNCYLWLVFQPHQYQRTYKLFNQFVNAFDDANQLVVLPIYSVPGRERDSIKKKVNSEMLVREIKNSKHQNQNSSSRLKSENIIYIDSFQKAKNYLKENLKKNDICIIMGAGDVYKLSEMLIKH